MSYGELKQIVYPETNVRSGSFARIVGEENGVFQIDNWIYCRDSFHYHFNNTKQLIFSHPAHAGKRIAAFINEFEKRMKHEKLTICGPTNLSRITWVQPAQFWLNKNIRKSLFTCLLRAGARYNPEENNFDEALNSVNYLSRTKEAVEWFLKGHTWPKKNTNGGWYDSFYHIKKSSLSKKLTRKPVDNRKLLEYAAGLLGTNIEKLKKEYFQNKILENTVKNS
jgi:hypothetical protein